MQFNSSLFVVFLIAVVWTYQQLTPHYRRLLLLFASYLFLLRVERAIFAAVVAVDTGRLLSCPGHRFGGSSLEADRWLDGVADLKPRRVVSI